MDILPTQTASTPLVLEHGPAALMVQLSRQRPDTQAFRFRDDLWSWRRLADSTDALAHGLLARGLVAGDRLVLHLTNVPEMIVALQACFRTGIIACPIRSQWTAAEVEALVGRLQPALYIGCRELYRNAVNVSQGCLPDDRRFLIDGSVAGRRWSDLLGPVADDEPLPPVPMERPALLITTSGTTAEPKLSAHSLSSLSHGAAACAARNLQADDHILLSLALGHASGVFMWLAAMSVGASSELMDRPLTDQILDTVERRQVTVVLLLPFAFADLLAAQGARPRDTQALRACLTGGDVTPLEVQRQCRERFGVRLQSFWAATEIVGAFDPGLEDGPLCMAAPGSDIALTDPEGRPVPRGQPGELRLRGPNLFLGYWQAPGSIDPARDDGWFRTGDIMAEQDDGQFRFVGRIKDIIIHGGTNVSPVEIEQVLVTHPAVAAACAFGVSDDRLGQRVQAAVELKSAATASDTHDIRTYAAARLADYKVPDVIHCVPSLPRNGLGKVDRRQVAEDLG